MGNERKERRRAPEDGQPAKDKPPATNRSFGALIDLLGLAQQEAGKRLGIEAGTVSEYVSGKRELFPANFRRKCAAFGEVAAAVGERLLADVAKLDAAAEHGPADPPNTAGLVVEIGREAERLAAALPATLRERAAEEARRQAAALWQDLKSLEVHEWRLFAAAASEYRCWAFVKLVGEESARTASVDARQALELASFALWVAERVTGEEGWASRVFGWAFLANARRVGGDLDGAEEAFACSARFQAERPEGELPEPWRLLDLEASLRISQRRLPEALRLLDRAEQAALRTGPVRARLLCIRSNALERLEDSEGSLEALRQALAEVTLEAEPQLFCILQFNLADSLASAGQAAEAEEMLPTLRRLQAQLGDGLNQIRLHWLEGKIDAGLGRLDRAIETLSSVRSDFSAEGLLYDEAQAGLDLARLYLIKGRAAEVKRLVRRMAPVFTAKGVHAEARKALDLFRQAVEREAATADLAGRVVGYLRRARHDPELVFEEAA